MPKCSYCNSTDHHIGNCTDGKHLEKLLFQDIKPNFYAMPLSVLKRISCFTCYKSTLPKSHLAYLLSGVWDYNDLQKKERLIKEKQEKQKHENEKKQVELDQDEKCCICMENDVTNKNIAVLKCGHTFCLECILIHHQRSRTCPLCRASYCNNDDSSVQIHTIPNENSNENGYNEYISVWNTYPTDENDDFVVNNNIFEYENTLNIVGDVGASAEYYLDSFPPDDNGYITPQPVEIDFDLHPIDLEPLFNAASLTLPTSIPEHNPTDIILPSPTGDTN